MVSNESSEITGNGQRSSSQSLPATATLEKGLQILESNSPLNLAPISNYIRQEFISRISFFENKVSKVWLFRNLVRLGIPPLYLFIALIIVLGIAVGNMYRRSVYLLCNLVGVVYPTYKSIRAINNNEKGNLSIVVIKQWLTYWTVYGWLQVADYWSNWLLEMFPGYNLFKLIFLYWAQSDRSKGATLIYERILKPLLQKNIQNNDKRQTLRQRQQQQYNSNELHQQPPIQSIKVVEGIPSHISEPTPEEIWRRDTVMSSRESEIKPYRLNNV